MLMWRSFVSMAVGVAFLAGRSVQGADAPVFALEPGAQGFFVREWLVAGPFPSEPLATPTPEGYTRAGFERDFLGSIGGERAAIFDTDTTIEEVGGVRRLSARENGAVDLTQLFGDGERRVAYLFAWVDSAEAQTITFFFGSDDGGKVWVNGERVHTAWIAGGRGVRFREETFRANLKAGRNALLVKIEQNGPGWGTAIEVLPRAVARTVLEPTLQLEPRVAGVERKGARWDVRIEAGLNHDETLFPELTQRLSVTGVDGQVVLDRELAGGERVTVEVPEGAYRILSRGVRRKELGGETAVLAMEDTAAFANEQLAGARAAAADSRWNATAGWFQYLGEKLENALAAMTPDTDEIARQAYRIARWRAALAGDIDAWRTQRGSIEWAYRSNADGSGQPFTLRIPEMYTDERTWPLVVNLHGAGGTHGSRWGEAQREPVFELMVNGRGRTGGYIELSEVDVLEATDYVQRHWRIAEDEVHLTGGSMGGYGTFTLGARHPDRWATAVPWAGSAAHLPTENMLNVPTYALHSDDDFVVPVSGARAAVRWINGHGGTAVMAETTGLGHQFGRWSEGRAAMLAWRAGRKRVASEEAPRVVYTAIDELARGANWVRIEEWGGQGKPAKVDARFDRANALHVDVENARVLRIGLAESPADLGRRLDVVVNGTPVTRLEAPLPREIFLRRGEAGWTVAREASPAFGFRLHFPGGVTALFHGEPLLVVYGTLGPRGTTARLKAMAETGARHSRFSPATVEMRPLMTHGGLPVKADRDVTPEDLERCNVIVLGSAKENALAARWAGRLPVKIDAGAKRLVASDGQAWAWDGRGFGLLHFNPDEPARLLYWIAAEDPALYDANGVLVALHAGREPAPDFVVADAGGALVAARRFDSRWAWERGYKESPHVSVVGGNGGAAEWQAAALRKALGCDFVVQEDGGGTRAPWKHADETRVADLAVFSYAHRLATMTLTGAELKEAAKAADGPRSRVRILPRPDSSAINDGVRYRVGLVGLDMRAFAMTTRVQPGDFQLIDITAREVLWPEGGLRDGPVSTTGSDSKERIQE